MRMLLSCLLSGFCFGSLPAAAQNAQQPFTARITVESPAVSAGPERYTIKEGSELFVSVHLTNTSKRNLAFGYDKDSRTGVCFAHQYEVLDRDGVTAHKRTIKHPEIVMGHGWPARVLKPGESIDIPGDQISLLYDLSRPGEYIVQLSRAINDEPKNGFVKSNIITLTITK